MGLGLNDVHFDQWEWKEELKVLNFEEVSFGEWLRLCKVPKHQILALLNSKFRNYNQPN